MVPASNPGEVETIEKSSDVTKMEVCTFYIDRKQFV